MGNFARLFLRIPIEYKVKLQPDELVVLLKNRACKIEKEQRKRFLAYYTNIKFRRINKDKPLYRFGPDTWGNESQLELKIESNEDGSNIEVVLFPKIWLLVLPLVFVSIWGWGLELFFVILIIGFLLFSRTWYALEGAGLLNILEEIFEDIIINQDTN